MARKELSVRKTLVATGLSVLLLAVPAMLAHAAPIAKSSTGTVVIVFKDGHRQTFNLADIDRLEFPVAAAAASDTPSTGQMPPRGRFFGKWEVGDGSGGNFFITLKPNGEAHRTLHEVDGHWVYVNGEAQVTWDDGAMDAIRKVGSRFQKFAYAAGKSFTDSPDNVTEARNTAPQPI